MTKNYKVVNGLTITGQTVFIVSNYHGSNLVTTTGFITPVSFSKNDIGVWKIKQCKINQNDKKKTSFRKY